MECDRRSEWCVSKLVLANWLSVQTVEGLKQHKMVKGIKVIRKDRLRRKGMTTTKDVTVPREGEEACKEGKEEEGGRLVIKYESVYLQVASARHSTAANEAR